MPVIVFIHDGGLINRYRNRFYKHILKMAKRGFVATSVMYRLASEHRFPPAIEGIKATIRFLKAHHEKLNLDPNHKIVSRFPAVAI